MAVTPADDHFHDPDKFGREWDRSTWWWNESGWFNFHVPERSISGIFYVHHRPLNNCLWAGTALWTPTAIRRRTALYYDWNLHVKPAKCDTFDFELPTTGFKLEMLEELKTFHFTYRPRRLQGRSRLGGVHPAPGPDRARPAEGVDGVDDPRPLRAVRDGQGRDHDRRRYFEVDDLSARDHSWGPHRMTETGRGTFTWGVANQDLGFFPYVVAKEPVPTDDIFDVVDDVKGGWYLKDGEISTLVSGERRVERDDHGRPLHETLTATDALGRELHAEGEVRNHLFFQGFPSTGGGGAWSIGPSTVRRRRSVRPRMPRSRRTGVACCMTATRPSGRPASKRAARARGRDEMARRVQTAVPVDASRYLPLSLFGEKLKLLHASGAVDYVHVWTS